MGRAKPTNAKQTVSEETAPATEEETVATPKRDIVKEKFVLDTNVNVPVAKEFKKGERISGSDKHFLNIKTAFPNSYKQAAINVFELTETVTIQGKEKIPCGTIVDPVKDKELFDKLKDVSGGIKKITG